MNKYIRVDGYNGLARDKNSGAIINIDSVGMSKARNRKKVWKEQQEELETLRNDVAMMKQMMQQILEGNNGSNND
jgi:Ribonuclease G/E